MKIQSNKLGVLFLHPCEHHVMQHNSKRLRRKQEEEETGEREKRKAGEKGEEAKEENRCQFIVYSSKLITTI
jgi:hypothetical protein